jgi:polar amino acid transport system substrate-binding protein
MIRRFKILALLILSVLLGACSTAGMGIGGAPSTAVDRILSSGVLRVGVSANQPPFNMRDKQGAVIGLDADLAKALASALNVEASFAVMPFGELLPALEAGEVDLVVSGLTMTPERNLKVAFAGPYFISGKAILTKSANLAAIESPGELGSIRVSALAGSTSQQFVERFISEADLTVTPSYDEAVRMVVDGEVDAMVGDFPGCVLSVLRHPDAGLSTIVSPYTFEPIGIGLPPDAPLLTNLIENYLTLLEGTGLLEQLRAKWFADGSWLAQLP